ncbi:hypothetical protein Vretimale_5223, partial [Volvox reticuliferus]
MVLTTISAKYEGSALIGNCAQRCWAGSGSVNCLSKGAPPVGLTRNRADGPAVATITTTTSTTTISTASARLPSIAENNATQGHLGKKGDGRCEESSYNGVMIACHSGFGAHRLRVNCRRGGGIASFSRNACMCCRGLTASSLAASVGSVVGCGTCDEPGKLNRCRRRSRSSLHGSWRFSIVAQALPGGSGGGKPRRVFVCSKCGARYSQYHGKCSRCGGFGAIDLNGVV